MADFRPVIIYAIFAAMALATCGGCSSHGGDETVNIAGESFSLEVSADPPSIEKGLMDRKTIPDGTGMIFIFPDAQPRGFWMKNCLTDMDIIFLDSRGYVTATHHMKTEALQRDNETQSQYELRLKRYSSAYPAQFAIELPPGSLDQLNVKFEDKIALDLKRLKALAK